MIDVEKRSAFYDPELHHDSQEKNGYFASQFSKESAGQSGLPGSRAGIHPASCIRRQTGRPDGCTMGSSATCSLSIHHRTYTSIVVVLQV